MTDSSPPPPQQRQDQRLAQTGVLKTVAQGRAIINTSVQAHVESIAVLADGLDDKSDTDLVMQIVPEVELAAVAELLLVEVAIRVLADTPAAWSQEQADRIRRPFELFRVERLAKLKDPVEFRQALLVPYDHQPEPDSPVAKKKDPNTPDLSQTLEWHRPVTRLRYRTQRHVIESSCSHEQNNNPLRNPLIGPRVAATSLVEIAGRIWFSPRPVPRKTLDQLSQDQQHLPDWCMVSWRRLEPEDKVRGVLLQFVSHPDPESSEEEEGAAVPASSGTPAPQTYNYLGAMDHGLVKDRLPPGHPGRDSTGRVRVSDLGIRLIAFAQASVYLVQHYLPEFEASFNAVSGIMSHQVLKDQRESRKGGSKKLVVLKKNKPEYLETRFASFIDCTFTENAVERIVECYMTFKRLQVGFLTAARLLGDIRQAQTLD